MLMEHMFCFSSDNCIVTLSKKISFCSRKMFDHLNFFLEMLILNGDVEQTKISKIVLCGVFVRSCFLENTLANFFEREESSSNFFVRREKQNLKQATWVLTKKDGMKYDTIILQNLSTVDVDRTWCYIFPVTFTYIHLAL